MGSEGYQYGMKHVQTPNYGGSTIFTRGDGQGQHFDAEYLISKNKIHPAF